LKRFELIGKEKRRADLKGKEVKDKYQCIDALVLILRKIICKKKRII
jgi:hypothetical protein